MRIFGWVFLVPVLAACAMPVSGVEVAREDYMTLCAGCHGPAGQGDGDLAPMLSTPPPDLTGLSARNGGTFPIVDVLSQIDGYGRGHRPYEGVIMPEFGQLMTSEMTFVDTGDGVMTPTPVRLADLAAYIESLQAP